MRTNLLIQISFLIITTSSYAKESTLILGDAVLTQFSGVITPSKNEIFPQKIIKLNNESITNYEDEIFINTQNPSLIIKSLETKDNHIWDASILQNKEKLRIQAKDIGQVFGLTLDNDKNPNIYATATSFYGLNIVLPDVPNKIKIKSENSKEEYKIFITNDKDSRPEKQLRGIKNAKWMDGQFGKNGTPGSIWKINSKTGKISKFTDIKLNGIKNSGPALGNITFDSIHKQFFVSDLDTGMIHRISKNGKDLEHYDHGISARKLYRLKLLPHNPLNRADIFSKSFDTTNIKTWGYAKEGRRIYGLSYIQNRLFYAVYNGKNKPSEIWSVGINKKGNFTKNIRFEVKLDKLIENLPITDMIITNDGQMILSQRDLNQGSYDMSNFTQNKKAQTVRYHLRVPNKNHLQRWYPEPQEYFIGFNENFRKSSGGISFGYNYNEKGEINLSLCNKSLWISGENLRYSKEFSSILGDNIDGIQGIPSILSNINKPAWESLFLSYSKQDYLGKGYMGDVEIYQKNCQCNCNKVNYENIITNKTSLTNPSNPNRPNTLPTEHTLNGNISTDLSILIFPPINCLTFPSIPGCKNNNNSNVTNSIPKLCMEAKTTPAGPFDEGGGLWSFPIQITSLNSNIIDSVKITPINGVTSITNGPIFPVGTPNPILSGVSVGNYSTVNLCGFDSSKAKSGEPFDCCNMKVKLKIRPWQSSDDNQQLEVVR